MGAQQKGSAILRRTARLGSVLEEEGSTAEKGSTLRVMTHSCNPYGESLLQL